MNNLQQLKQDSRLRANAHKGYGFIKKPVVLLALVLGSTIANPALAAVWSKSTAMKEYTEA
ncbi:MAG: hypothetical protein ABL933_06475 [Methyloglobulus sp.]|nr:hypothetical protein [Methyloglobulus sp.]